MNFYSLAYLENQGSLNTVVKYTFIFAMLVFFVFVLIRYLRSRLNTRYRDLSIILFLILFFIIGVQYTDYQQDQAQQSSSTQMVSFLKAAADQLNVDHQKVYVNNRSLVDETLLLADGEYYVVKLSNDRSSFRLAPTYLMNTDVKLIESE